MGKIMKEGKQYGVGGTHVVVNNTTINGITFSFTKVDKICMLVLGDGSTTSYVTSNTVMGYVPSGFEPIRQVMMKDDYSAMRLTINTDGSIRAIGNNIPDGTILRGTITYVLG